MEQFYWLSFNFWNRKGVSYFSIFPFCLFVFSFSLCYSSSLLAFYNSIITSMMTTLPSPPLSPLDTSYTSPNLMTNAPNPKSGYRKKAHHRHPPRRHDTFELIQALVIEHQRLEQQEYETMLREAPMISCRNTTNAPKGILVKNHNNNSNNNNNNNNNNNSNNNRHPNNKSLIAAPSPSTPSRTATTTTTTTLNNSLPQSPHDTNDHPCSTTTSTVLFSTTTHPRHHSHLTSATASSYSPPSSIGSSVPSSPSTSSLVLPSSPTTSAHSYSSSSISSPCSSSSSSSSSPPTHITRHHVVRFAPGPPKVYTYQRVPILQES